MTGLLPALILLVVIVAIAVAVVVQTRPTTLAQVTPSDFKRSMRRPPRGATDACTNGRSPRNAYRQAKARDRP